MKKNFIPISIIVLGYMCFALSTEAFKTNKEVSQNLRIAFLDVGQGDAIFIQAPNGKQILVDGGPKDVVIKALKEVMPFNDTSIDMLVITNPDADHISGFSPILDSYGVSSVLEPGTRSTTPTYKDLISKIKKKQIPILTAYKDMKVVLDPKEDIYLDVLFPDQKVRGWESNDGSIVMRLVYGQTSVMLSGDATELTEKIISVTTDKERLQSSILKLGHHGSKTSTSESWIEAVLPSTAIVSVSLHNTYGHPHEEVMKRLEEKNIEVIQTGIEGSIIYESNGSEFVRVDKK